MLDDLNPAQRLAVERTEGPVLVIAGAGSGKTRVLTHRIAHLIRHHDVYPWHILAVTFTNKAAGEMRERMAQLVGTASGEAWIGTFHSVCARILRYEAKAFGLDSNFTIYDEDDRRSAIRRVLAELRISEEDLDARRALASISRAKNAMIGCAQFAEQAGDNPYDQLVGRVYKAYETALRGNHALDFDDLIVEPVRQFRRCPEVLDKYRQRFRYILVDEYQDTNRPQYLLTRLLAEEHHNICCVGDDDQSIYGFRGADIRNILDFEKDYPEAQVIRLEQNYRSTGHILAVANAVISHNRGRKGKKLWTDAGDGALIELAECADDRAEARHVVATVTRLCREEGLTLGDAAVLYRTNAQSRSLEEELQKGSIPYTIIGGIRFYERREVKDLIAYLRVLVNPADDVSLMRVINVPKRGIGGTTVERLSTFARDTSSGLTEALTRVAEIPGLAARARGKLQEFADLLSTLTALAHQPELDLAELAEQVLERTGYLDALADTPDSTQDMTRRENVGQLVGRMAEFAESKEEPTLSGFLEEVALMTSADEQGAESAEYLTLMTLHMAKGLEFPLVFITGLEEHLFPTSRAIEESRSSPASMEEERRLFYVGITRARRHLVLAWSRWRYIFGALKETKASRFLEEVPRELVEEKEIAEARDMGMRASARRASVSSRRGYQFSAPAPVKVVPKPAAPKGVHYEWDESEAAAQSSSDDGSDLMAVGSWVLHPSWGRGQIVDREGSRDDLKLSIRFGGGRTKKVLVAYARLEPA